jgi:hypothetical protein
MSGASYPVGEQSKEMLNPYGLKNMGVIGTASPPVGAEKGGGNDIIGQTQYSTAIAQSQSLNVPKTTSSNKITGTLSEPPGITQSKDMLELLMAGNKLVDEIKSEMLRHNGVSESFYTDMGKTMMMIVNLLNSNNKYLGIQDKEMKNAQRNNAGKIGLESNFALPKKEGFTENVFDGLSKGV